MLGLWVRSLTRVIYLLSYKETMCMKNEGSIRACYINACTLRKKGSTGVCLYEAWGSLLNSKQPFMLKMFYNEKNEPFWHKGSL